MNKKLKGLLILLIVYIIAIAVGVISFILLEDYLNILLNILVADVIATIIVWIFGIFLKTASVYDPYWSIQTVVIYIGLLIKYDNLNMGNFLFLFFIFIWAFRLTFNFCQEFNDLSYIDWRYKKIKEKTKCMYQIVSLLGIHLVPTLIVYAASVPAFLYVINNVEFSVFNIIGYIIIILAVMLEFFADIQMKKFRRERTDRKQIINIGLWRHSRHPNYLGEILFWYGVGIVLISSNIGMWYTITGAFLNTLLFLFISIPLAENNMALYKEGYADYKKKTRMLLPIRR